MFCENLSVVFICGEGCTACVYNYNETTIESSILP